VTQNSAAEDAFARLAPDRRELLLRRTFEILEYDEEGEPGGKWSSDTAQAIGDLWVRFGVKFTTPESVGRE